MDREVGGGACVCMSCVCVAWQQSLDRPLINIPSIIIETLTIICLIMSNKKQKRSDGRVERRSRDWAITIPYYDPVGIASWVTDRSGHNVHEMMKFDQFLNKCGLEYFIAGEEVGDMKTQENPEGYHHFQCYARFTAQKRLSTAKKSLGWEGAHFECARGTPDHNRKYCSKDGKVEEVGVFPVSKQGKRTDLAIIWKAIRNLEVLTEFDMIDRWPNAYGKYGNKMVRMLSLALNRAPRSKAPTVTVFWGKTGCGKSHTAWETYPDADSISFDSGGS